MKTIKHWKAFFTFIKNPTYSNQEVGFRNKVLLVINSFILKILLIVPIVIIYGLYITITKDIPEVMHDNVMKLYHPVILFTMVAVLEEFSFRGFLAKYNPIYFSISIAGILFIFAKKILYRNMIFEPEGLFQTVLISLILIPVIYFFANKYREQLHIFWENNFKYIFYFVTFLFAFAHFFNSVDLELGNLKIIIILLIGSFVLGFVRIRSGLFFAIIFHFVWDMMVV